MRRMPLPNLVLAATLALLLPLEQAHCAWMAFERHPAPAAVTGHECCASAPSSDPGRATSPESAGCVCEKLPTGTLPIGIMAGAEPPSVTSIAVLIVPSVIAPVSLVTETIPALDVGSSPLPDDPGAHGLRAPPVSA